MLSASPMPLLKLPKCETSENRPWWMPVVSIAARRQRLEVDAAEVRGCRHPARVATTIVLPIGPA